MTIRRSQLRPGSRAARNSPGSTGSATSEPSYRPLTGPGTGSLPLVVVVGGVDTRRVAVLVLRRLAAVAMAAVVLALAPAWWPTRTEAGIESHAASVLGPGEELAVVSRARQATVRVVGRSCDRVAVGTGFAVRHPDGPAVALVTNAHLLGPDRRLKVDLPGRRFLSDPMTADSGVDLAVSASAGEEVAAELRPLHLAGDRPEVGDEVVMAGYPGGRRMEARQARVRAVVGGRPYGVDGAVVLLDGATALGYSGGPVLDRSGDVVAVLRGYDAATGLIIAIHGQEVVELLSAGTGVALQFEPNDSCEG